MVSLHSGIYGVTGTVICYGNVAVDLYKAFKGSRGSMGASIVPNFSRISPIVNIYWTEIIANPKDSALAHLQNAPLVS
jgi:hypothetical protein